MKTFFKAVDTRSRTAMTNFLVNHFRYPTMNSWNRSTSFANNVKLHNLHLPHDVEDKFYEALQTEDYYDFIHEHISDFCYDHDGKWQIGTNGRSGGYLVLYSGGKRASEYKSYCTKCGQRNFKTVEETGNCKCGACGAEARRNFPRTIYEYYTSTKTVGGDSADHYENLSMSELKELVKAVQDLDKFCDDLLADLVEMLRGSEIVAETVMVPKTVKVIKEAV